MPNRNSEQNTYDVIVIGSGASGSIAAKELAENGLNVLVLEAGNEVPVQSGPKRGQEPKPGGVELSARIVASLAGQYIQARVAFFSAVMKPFLVNDWCHPYRAAANTPFLWIRGRQVGGRLNVFGRVLLRWSDYDFNGSSRRGGAGDWPITYADLVPYYERIERLFRIHGNCDHVTTAPDGIMAYSAQLTDAEQAFRQAVEAKWPERRVVAWRFAARSRTALPTALAAALSTGRVTLRGNAVVKHITTDQETGRATGVAYVERQSRQQHYVTARAVVMAASPVESVRLLLNSRSQRHPHGIGNSKGLVGRYFMDQPAALVFATCPARPDSEAVSGTPAPAPYGGIYIPSYTHRKPTDSDEVEAGYSFQGTIARRAAHPASSGVAASFLTFGEMLPYADNTVSIDTHRCDRWGIPIPIIRCALHDNERRILERQIQDAIEMIEASGGLVEGWASPLGIGELGKGLFPHMNPVSRWLVRKMMPRSMVMGAAIHESGGARMGSDPATSVLDPYNACWDAPNLFVTDASAFPSSGAMGTTLTVMALTARACERLAKHLKAETM